MTAPRVGDWATVPFRKSSFSSTNGGDCVEVGTQPGVVAVRDSKVHAAGLVELPATAWAEFLSVLRA
ncbi:DUF397 domain-containing protein [Actinophytocola glycyrrhizae]|uniref:DUF397 domain-containing protein n=1 Tax=Actinophytocola glycyrrhizae TaxID=2044873 RepID=A0ABV9RXQ8_9PSEU